MAVRHGDDVHPRQINARLCGNGTQLSLWGNQHRMDEACTVRIDGTLQRVGITGMHHATTHGLQVRTQRQQIGVALLGVKQADVRRMDAWQAQFLSWRHHFGNTVQHAFAFLIDQQAIEI